MDNDSTELKFTLPREVASKVLGLFRSGRQARILITFHNRQIVGVEAQDIWLSPQTVSGSGNGVSAQRTFYPTPTATGVYLAGRGTL